MQTCCSVPTFCCFESRLVACKRSKLQFSRIVRLVAQERERIKLASVRMQTKCKTSSCCCCCCFHLPPRLHSFRGCSKPCESSAKSALKSLSDSQQETSPLLPRDPPPHQFPSPLDHLVGGGGDELPRAALLSWGGTLLVLVGGRTARGREVAQVGGPRPAGIHGSEAVAAAARCPPPSAAPTSSDAPPNFHRLLSVCGLQTTVCSLHATRVNPVNCIALNSNVSNHAFSTQYTILLAPNRGASTCQVEV